MSGRVMMVVGGASGIGGAASKHLAKDGCRVVVCDRDEAMGHATVEAIRSEGGQAQFIRTDVLDEDSVRAAVAKTVADHGRLDGAMNSAGIETVGKPVHELDVADWDRCVDINLRGMFLCVKHQLRAMLDCGGGAIVAVSSASGVIGMPESSDYCAAKAGVLGLVRAAALEYAQLNIRINALLPGATATPLSKRSSAAAANVGRYVHIPIARMARPHEIAAVAVWLLSDQASYVTGAMISADGGMTTL